MKLLTNSQFQTAIASGITVVDFYADWCGPCKMIAPYLEEMATKMEGKADFYKVDVDAEQDLSQDQGITAMPTIKVFKDGAQVAMIRGADTQAIWKAVNDAIVA